MVYVNINSVQFYQPAPTRKKTNKTKTEKLRLDYYVANNEQNTAAIPCLLRILKCNGLIYRIRYSGILLSQHVI